MGRSLTVAAESSQVRQAARYSRFRGIE